MASINRKHGSNYCRNLFVCCIKGRFVMGSFLLFGILMMCLYTYETQSYQAIDESELELVIKSEQRNDPLSSGMNHKVLRKRTEYTVDNGKLEKKQHNDSILDMGNRTLSYNNMGKRFSICVYGKNDIVSSAVRGGGGWERGLLTYMNNYIIQYSKNHNVSLSDLTFIDIGANVGWFSFNMAALGVNVLAFEPMEENIQLIKKSLQLKENIDNGVSDRITLYPYGLGVKEETCYLYSKNTNVGDGHVNCVEHESEVQLKEDYDIRGKIEVRRLDDIINLEGNPVPVAKMDVEGYEAHVLEGGSKAFLGGQIEILITEFVPEWIEEKGGDPRKFMKQFNDSGYSSIAHHFLKDTKIFQKT